MDHYNSFDEEKNVIFEQIITFNFLILNNRRLTKKCFLNEAVFRLYKIF